MEVTVDSSGNLYFNGGLDGAKKISMVPAGFKLVSCVGLSARLRNCFERCCDLLQLIFEIYVQFRVRIGRPFPLTYFGRKGRVKDNGNVEDEELERYKYR